MEYGDLIEQLVREQVELQTGQHQLATMFQETVVFDETEFGKLFEGEGEDIKVIEENFNKFISKTGGALSKTAGALGATSLVLYALGAAGASIGAGVGMVGLAAAAIIVRRMPINVAKRIDAKLIGNVRERDILMNQLISENVSVSAMQKIQKQLAALTTAQKKIGQEYMKVLDEKRVEILEYISDKEFAEIRKIAEAASEGHLTNIRDLIGKSLAIR